MPGRFGSAVIRSIAAKCADKRCGEIMGSPPRCFFVDRDDGRRKYAALYFYCRAFFAMGQLRFSACRRRVYIGEPLDTRGGTTYTEK